MALSHVPKKRFGQNFLRDEGVIHQIIESVTLKKNDTVIEIGPGLGALTQHLTKKIDHLYAIEIDKTIAKQLTQEFSDQKLTIYNQDVLTFDFSAISGLKKIIGNLPYNISTTLLFYLIDFIKQINIMYFMLQKEVANRLLSAPSSHNYGRLTVLMQYHFAIQHLFDVPADAFWPKPKVESAFICLKPNQTQCDRVDNIPLFQKIVASAFNQRRKTLRNTLKNWVNGEIFEELGIDPKLRAENLSVQTFAKLSNKVNHSLSTRECIKC